MTQVGQTCTSPISRTNGALRAKCAPSFTCARCAVTVTNPAHPEPNGLPAGWAQEGGDLRCLACRRELAVEAASETETASRVLVGFELRRDPSRPAKAIARATGASAHFVGQVRRELVERGDLVGGPPVPAAARTPAPAQPRAKTPVKSEPRPSASRPRTAVERHPRVAAELRRDPRRSNLAIARAAGLTQRSGAAKQVVRSVRLELEDQGLVPYRAEGTARGKFRAVNGATP